VNTVEEVVRALSNRIQAWVMNTVEEKFDVDWDITASEEQVLNELIRAEINQLGTAPPKSRG
jgi:hypothetical protein